MPELLPILQKGKAPTLLEADFANQVMRLLNAIASMTVEPAGCGTFVATGQNAKLDLSALKQKLDAVALAVQQTTPTNITDLIERVKTLETTVATQATEITTIKTRLDNASAEASASCNEDGTITISITLSI